MLIGLNGDTPLGQTINIRSEKDNEKLRKMSAHEKKIRNDWFKFKNEKKTTIDKKQEERKIIEVQNILKSMFGR